ncbi:efflux RND transporter periplasmic adaptor subunit [Flavimaricola marinus]|uniref:Multidrug resistance protein MdtA n=1 Tax=Flavimaricola marinus TaxID=1819565 RepID=A0A238LJM4_9RHOB|nr:efflux RND transporter periplasmic adaptor subunit [Flavimaricola marinus]SMY09090.1 Multidrug resistance protein MdtA precursor [Flavimaricola marinus]
MKLMPLLTAVLVSAFLYFAVFERDRLLAFAQVTSDNTEEQIESIDTDRSQHTISVVAQHSEAQTVDSVVVLRGRTEAARSVEIRGETSGQIISEPLRKGAFVNAGDLLCELDPGTREASLAEARARLSEAESRVPEAEAGLAEARARVREAEINVNNARRLSEGGFSSETALISAEATAEAALAGVSRANSAVISAQSGIEAAQAAVAAAEREIERLTITAPFPGLLETDAAELGSLMQAGGLCATIVQLDPIKLVGFVPEADLDKIELGALAGARLASGREVQGRVTFLSRSGDETTRTFRLEVEVANPDLAIRDGQTADILVAAEGRQAHLLPQSSLTLDDNGVLGVRVVDDENTARFMPVTLLRDTVDGVWVADLPETVDVIVVGQEYVIDGVPVAPTFKEANG